MSVESEPTANTPSSTRPGFTGRWMGYFVRVASLAVAAIYLASVFLGRFWPFELLTHFRLQIAVVMLALAVVLLLSRRGLWKWPFGFFYRVGYLVGDCDSTPEGSATGRK